MTDRVKIKASIRSQIKADFDINEKKFTAAELLFNSVIKPELSKNYLSHLKTAVEDLINAKKSKELFDKLASTGVDPNQRAILVAFTKSKRFRPFAIILAPIHRPSRKAWTDLQETGSVVYYMDELDAKEKRVLIAHELAHIALHFLGKHPERSFTEGEVNLLAMIAMLDKNHFYNEDYKEFTYGSDEDLLQAFKHLCVRGIR